MVVGDKNDKIKIHKFILCNDILVVSTLASSFKTGQLIAVYPLIGLRIAREPKLSDTLLNNDKNKDQELKYRFALVPQNKNFSPSDTNCIGSIIIICSDHKQLEKWIETIEDTVDEEEHNLKPCNPVDLEKRLRKQKTSKEGEAETITITDPEKIKEIEAWKEAKASGQPLRKIRSQKSLSLRNQNSSTHGSDEEKQSNSNSATPKPAKPARPSRSMSGSPNIKPPPRPSGPPSRPPPRRATLNSHRRQQSGTGLPSKPPSKPPPTKTNRDTSPSPKNRTSAPPKKAPTSSSKINNKFKNAPPPQPTLKETEITNNTPSIPSKGGGVNSKKPTHKKNNSRASMLAGIQAFSKTKSLRHVDAETLQKEAAAKPQNVTSLLQSTLKNYRQFVMDDDDSDDSDGGWDD